MSHPCLPSDSRGRAEMCGWLQEGGQSQSAITLPHLKPPEKGCHPVHCHSLRTRSCRSQPWRDTDRVGWRGHANALSVVMARHAGIEPAWTLLSPAAQILCPFPWGREARLKLSQWEQSVPLSTVSAWDFPKHDTGWPAHLTTTTRHLQERREICSFREALWINARWLQGMTESTSWSLLEILIRLLRHFNGGSQRQRRREFVAEEKKSEMQWLEQLII